MPRYFSDHLDAGSPGNPPKRENYTDIAEYATAMRKYRMLNPTIVRPVAADTPQTTKLPGNRVRIGGNAVIVLRKEIHSVEEATEIKQLQSKSA